MRALSLFLAGLLLAACTPDAPDPAPRPAAEPAPAAQRQGGERGFNALAHDDAGDCQALEKIVALDQQRHDGGGGIAVVIADDGARLSLDLIDRRRFGLQLSLERHRQASRLRRSCWPPRFFST